MKYSTLFMLTTRSLILALPIAVILSPLFSLSAIAQTPFGLRGQDGDRGRDGRNGRDGQNIKIVGDGKSISHDLNGATGEDGEDGTAGRSANSCEQPYRPEYSLLGASGGNGGNGGNGGRGGNGGNATIFYTDLAALQQIEIQNAGGLGGRNGQGAIAGKGCECQKSEWRIRYCDWKIERRPFKDAKAPWQYDSTETHLCRRSSDDFDFFKSSPKVSEYRQDDWLYRRTSKGVSRTDSYSCQAGRDGAASSNGRNGETGSYGRVTLVPRLDIPAEINSDREALGETLGKKVGLIKNIWVERSGLSRLLRPSSDVSDQYTYLKDTARLFYRFEWAAQATPQTLGIDRVEVGAIANVRNETAGIDFQIPATLEYQISNEPNLQVVKITGGFAPDRVSAFKLEKISGVGTENQLVLSDRGNVRDLLKDTQIEVQCFSKESATGIIADDYIQRHSIKFKVPPKLEPSNGAIVNGNIYTLPVGRYCSPWLK
ncbi:MAG: hypothetical protein WCP16_26060 [Pseudanabaena sp. ELA645]|jgi:hypothetical protein